MTVQSETCASGAGARDLTRDSSWGLGIGLIVFGVLALFAQTVPHANWVTMWPLFFVAVGVVQMITPSRFSGWTAHRFAEGMGTVLFGVVLLGCTTGYVAWSMWITLISLWPLLLVVGGLRILGRSADMALLSAVATVIVWGALLFSAAGSWTGTARFEPLSAVTVQEMVRAPQEAATAFADTIVDAVVGPLASRNR